MCLVIAILPSPLLLTPSLAIFKLMSILKYNVYIISLKENQTYLVLGQVT